MNREVIAIVKILKAELAQGCHLSQGAFWFWGLPKAK